MKFENFGEKFKNFCQKVGRRNFIIFGAVLLIGAAIVVNFVVMSAQNSDGYDYDKSVGMQDTGSPSTDVGNNGNDEYFSSIEVSRKRSRDEAIEVLQSVVDSQSSTEAAKNEALLEIAGLAKVMEQESNIETLVIAKGFENCVAVISDGKANIVVTGAELLPAEISQINEIVYDQAGILPVNINITGR